MLTSHGSAAFDILFNNAVADHVGSNRPESTDTKNRWELYSSRNTTSSVATSGGTYPDSDSNYNDDSGTHSVGLLVPILQAYL